MTQTEQNECFDRWLNQHGAMLHHVANGFAEGTDRHDLMQELLLALWRAIPAYRHGASPSTFIYRVAHNAALTWKRGERNYRQRIDRFEALGSHDAHLPSDSADHDREILERLYVEIRKLPPLDRSLVLMMLDDLSYAAMAEIHGLTESNVGVRLHRLKQKLTDAMKGAAHELR